MTDTTTTLTLNQFSIMERFMVYIPNKGLTVPSTATISTHVQYINKKKNLCIFSFNYFKLYQDFKNKTANTG